MALFGLFGKGPLTPEKIDKIAKLASNPFAQPDVRMREMQRLFADGSEAALRGVLKRFAANASGAIADEDEKKWLEDALVDLGEPALPPLRTFIKNETQLTYALRAYRGITGDAEAVRFFLEVLTAHGPEDHRSVDAKLQLVLELGADLADPRVVPGLIGFLHDHSDDVRWAVMDLVERAADQGRLVDTEREAVCNKLGEILFDGDVGPRIQQRAAEILSRREWSVPGDTGELAPPLEDVFFLDKKRYLRRRVRPRE
jgi:HEAT repeat protein